MSISSPKLALEDQTPVGNRSSHVPIRYLTTRHTVPEHSRCPLQTCPSSSGSSQQTAPPPSSFPPGLSSQKPMNYPEFFWFTHLPIQSVSSTPKHAWPPSLLSVFTTLAKPAPRLRHPPPCLHSQATTAHGLRGSHSCWTPSSKRTGSKQRPHPTSLPHREPRQPSSPSNRQLASASGPVLTAPAAVQHFYPPGMRARPVHSDDSGTSLKGHPSEARPLSPLQVQCLLFFAAPSMI